MSTLSMDRGLAMLVEKYGPADCPQWKISQTAPSAETRNECIFVPGTALAQTATSAANVIPLLPWRQSRRCIEMRNMIKNETIEDISMARVRNFSLKGTSISEVLYREFDLLQWMTGSTITSIFATMREDKLAGNLAIRLANGVCCGMEICAALTGTEEPIDRHEFIARRGVVCDQVVDSVTRPSSVNVFGKESQKHTDTDAELFGLCENEITLVRAAHEALLNQEKFATLRSTHRQLVALVNTALNSASQCRRLDVEGVAV